MGTVGFSLVFFVFVFMIILRRALIRVLDPAIVLPMMVQIILLNQMRLSIGRTTPNLFHFDTSTVNPTN